MRMKEQTVFETQERKKRELEQKNMKKAKVIFPINPSIDVRKSL